MSENSNGMCAKKQAARKSLLTDQASETFPAVTMVDGLSPAESGATHSTSGSEILEKVKFRKLARIYIS